MPLVRVGALIAVVAAAIAAGFALLGAAQDDYRVKARFQNAAQLVKGNLVQVGGVEAGKVEDIRITPDGQAEITMKLDSDHAPLRRGTEAIVRQASLSGVANRYIDLRMAPQGADPIPDGGAIGRSDTTTAVDLDELFNMFDEPTRKGLSQVLRGSARLHQGQGEAMKAGLLYLNPSLSASSRLFRELNRDSALLERFIVSTSQLVTDVAERRDDLAGLVDDLATTTGAIGSEKAALADAIGRMPDFLRRADTTFVNLRATLDDLDPLVDDSKPVAKELRPLLAQLRPLARDARPTLRDLSRLVRQPGPGNDLVELTRGVVPLRDVTVRKVQENGKERDGAFAASAEALRGGVEPLSFFRPYTPDLVGWFDDFSHSGIYDALGAASRVGLHASAFALLNGQLTPVPPALRDEAFGAAAALRQDNRCPGAAEHKADDGSGPWKPSEDFNCDLSQVLPGD